MEKQKLKCWTIKIKEKFRTNKKRESKKKTIKNGRIQFKKWKTFWIKFCFPFYSKTMLVIVTAQLFFRTSRRSLNNRKRIEFKIRRILHAISLMLVNIGLNGTKNKTENKKKIKLFHVKINFSSTVDKFQHDFISLRWCS